ncbi:tail fiber assembly-like protein [Vibrio phage PVP-XSN]|uniref:Tail fiber assembly-like protein n=1 Tax=Vibrio phage PVP-XSN TaxID=3056214 RepID=A0AAX3Y3X0_9CAUD|nr:tail fiber assembly-like protein [Vibrio phage PVP-XSN]
MKIYHYHPETKEYLGEGLADKDPMVADNWLIPAHATSTKPPQTDKNQSAVFDGNEWLVVADYRGFEYWLQNEEHHVINELGVEPPKFYFESKPEPEPPTEEELKQRAERNRVMEYADPINGSDKLFMEAIRKRAAGDEQGALTAERKGMERVDQIKKEFPLGV